MEKSITTVLLSFVLLLLVSCNNDLFVEDKHVSRSEIVLPGIGSESFVFPADDLASIEISFSDTRFNSILYDMDNNEVGREYGSVFLTLHNIYASQQTIRTAIIWNRDVEFKIEWSKTDHITITSFQNLSESAFNGVISFSYSYDREIETVDFTIESLLDSGDLYHITDMNLSPDIRNEINFESFTILIDNPGPDTLHYSFCPADYLNFCVSFDVPKLSHFSIEETEMPEIEIPSFYSTDSVFEVAGAFNGLKIPFSVEPVTIPMAELFETAENIFRKFPVAVPPGSVYNGVFSVQNLIMTSEGRLRLVRDIDDRAITLPAVATVTQPVYYSFKWTEVTDDGGL